MVAVTGAGTGIGQVIAVKFGALGWRVAVGGRRIDRLTETAQLVEDAGGACLPHQLDVTDGDSVERFFADVESTYGTVTAVINNAAIARYGPLDDFSPAEIAAEIATKLTGSLLMARRGIQAMRKDGRRWGHPLRHLARCGHSVAVPPAVRRRERRRRARGQDAASRARRIRHPRPEPALRGDRGYRLRHPRDGVRPRLDANQKWFRMNLLRHTGLMVPDDVADAVVTAVTLPRGHQYSVMEVIPAAPIGPLPETFEEWGVRVAENLAPQ